MTIYDRITLKLKEQRKTRKDLAAHLGMKYDSLNKVFDRQSSFRPDVLTSIAEYLNVTSDYLLGIDTIDNDTEMEIQVMNMFRKLPFPAKAQVIVYISKLLEETK